MGFQLSLDTDSPRVSLRWHMKKDGRTFIMYGSTEADVAARAKAGGYTNVEPSGYYSYDTNMIVNPKDGPTTFEDNRKSGF